MEIIIYILLYIITFGGLYIVAKNMDYLLPIGAFVPYWNYI